MSNTTGTKPVETAPLTIETLEKISKYVYETGTPRTLKRSLFERIMNRLGWHRRYKVFVIDSSVFKLGIKYFKLGIK